MLLDTNFPDVYEIYKERRKEKVYPGWCNLAIPVWFHGNRHSLTADETGIKGPKFGEYTFVNDLYPVTGKYIENYNDIPRESLSYLYEPLSQEEQAIQNLNCEPAISLQNPAPCQSLNWKAGRNFFEQNPLSKAHQLREKYHKISVAQISGHTLLGLNLLDILDITDNEKKAFIIAAMIWLVPFHHSMHEILMAARIHNTLDGEPLFNYDYKKDTVQEAERLYKEIYP